MRIQHNIMAMNAYRNYNNNTSALSANLEKLSSGYKINRAGDDAAGLAISEKMRAQITGLNKAQDNAKDGISLVQTAEGALTEVHDMLNRMYELAEQSANGTFEDAPDRTQLQKEVKQLIDEIDRIADSANFNGIELLDGSLSTDGTASLNVTAASDVNGVDLKFSAEHNIETASGSTVNLTFKFAAATASSANYEKATVTATGTVTLNLDVNKEYSAGDIQSMLANASASGVDSSILSAVQSTAVSGSGTTLATSGTAAWNTAATTGDAIAAGTGEALTLQIGDTSDDFNQLAVSIRDCHAAAIGIGRLNIANQDDAAAALNTIKSAINYVSDVRGTLGATQNRLDHTINNLSVMEENIQNAESAIRDTDVAEEMMEYTKNNILIQSAQAMLAQANAVPQGVLQLLQ